MSNVAWSVLMIIVVGALMYLLSDELNRAALATSSGYVESGSNFGIYIGMPVSDARQCLADRGLSPDNLTIPSRFVPPHTCLHRPYPTDHDVEAWADDTWRRGTICISSTQGKVASVAWRFDPIEAP